MAPPQQSDSAAVATYTVKRGDTIYSIARAVGIDYHQIAAWNNLDAGYHIHVDQVLRVSAPDTAAVAGIQSIGIASTSVEQRPLTGVAVADLTPRTQPSGAKRAYSDAAWAEVSHPESVPPAPEVASAAVAAPAVADAGQGDDNIAWGWPANGPLIGEFNEVTNRGINIGGKLGTPIVAAADGTVIYAGPGTRGFGNMVIVKNSANLLSVYAHNSRIIVGEKEAVKKGQKIAEMGDSDADRVELHFEIRLQSKPVDPLKYLPAR